jgi:hypothetical protein
VGPLSVKRLSDWAYGLSTRSRWVFWVGAAMVAGLLWSGLESPWSWLAVAPFLAFGLLLFQAAEKRQRDDQPR